MSRALRVPTKPSCRLFVIFARDASVAAVIRRGPSAWYHVIRWDLTNDAFDHGAWIRGRIYEEKCDLSPDGELFLYFVHQGRKLRSSYSDAWSAVSRLPWLHALALWPQGTTYGGGGRFGGNRDLTLRIGMSIPAHPKHLDHGLKVSFARRGYDDAPVHSSTEEVDGADWSGRDPARCLVFARGGKLFRHVAKRDIELADFNACAPNPKEAPAWARAKLTNVRAKRRK